MLAQIALVVFVLLGMLSLVIDVGYARITQGQMQNAADAAALEGIRQRDAGVLNAAGQRVNDAFASDCLRRAAANRAVHRVFDDDFYPANGDPDYQFGAGPIIDLTGGATSLHAFQTISVPEPHVYQPDLQLNQQQNAVHGDMVSGRFCYSADPYPSEGAIHADAIICDEPQRATGTYARNDFNPSPTVPQPPGDLEACPPADEPPPEPWPLPGSGSLATVNDGAFLVRLRRSNELDDLDGRTEPSVASSGPSLPLVFGRGATIAGDDPVSAYSPRRDGLTVRATAIAEVRPALHVGLPQAGQPGVTPFALRDTFVSTLPVVTLPVAPPLAGLQVTINPATGAICSGTTVCAGVNAPNAVGRFVDNLTDPTRTRWTLIGTVGQALPAPVPVACALATSVVGFGPVYSLMTSGTNRIIGFTRITGIPDLARPGNPCAKRVSRGGSLVAPSNATASLVGGLPLPVDAEPSDVRELLDKNRQRNGSLTYAPVLVAALAR